jgi:hypothetical protein
VIVFDPAFAQNTECGPAVLAVAGVAPVPKFHEYVAAPLAEPVKAIEAVWPSQSVDGTEKEAVLAERISTVAVDVEEQEPEVTVSVMVFKPVLAQLTE